MNFKFLFLTLAGFIVYGVQSFAQTGGNVGNGGDRLRELFANARIEAASILAAVDECSFDFEKVRVNDVKWLLQNRMRLRADVLSSPHNWVYDDRSTCAWTLPMPYAEISLSFKACRNENLTLTEAAQILIHESVHHLGFTDEVFPTAIASTVGLSQFNLTCDLGIPEELTAFDPHICDGEDLVSEDFTTKRFREAPLENLSVYEKIKRISKKYPFKGNNFSFFKPIAQKRSIKGINAGVNSISSKLSVSFMEDRTFGNDNKVILGLLASCGDLYPLFVDCGHISGKELSCPPFPYSIDCPELSTQAFQYKVKLTKTCVGLKGPDIEDFKNGYKITRTNGAVFWW